MNFKQILVMMMAVMVTALGWAASVKPKAPEFKCPPMGTVVYTTMDIPEGATIPTEALEERQVLQSRIPQDAVSQAVFVAGRVAKYGIGKGQIVSQHDVAAQS